MTDEPLLQFMQHAKTSDERLERLLVVEEDIVGAENKRTLASFITPIIASNGFENQLCSGAPVSQRLRRVAELQERVLRWVSRIFRRTRLRSRWTVWRSASTSARDSSPPSRPRRTIRSIG